MNSRRFSAIAHGLLKHAAPIAETTIEEVLDLLPLSSGSTALDVGCGRAELLLRLIKRFSLRATGVDLDPEVLARARREAERRGCADRLTLVGGSAHEAHFEESFDLTACIGSSHACGGYPGTLDAVSTWTKPGGYVLLGEGFWRRPPERAYLTSFGGSADELRPHHENVVLARGAGLAPVWSFVSRDEDWDRYEGLYRFAMSRFLEEHPDDPEAPAFRERSERWYDGYLRWGRDTMGFALYLFRKESA